MSRRRAYSQDTLDVMTRFFAALEKCIKNGLIKNVNQFCERYNVDSRHFYAQRKDIGLGYFEVGWLMPLIRDCGVSPSWLLTGKGLMFSQ